MTSLDVLLKGIVFGLGAAIPIGPINVEIARRAILRGWAHGVCLGLGAVSVDVIYACLAVAGVSVAAGSPWVFWPLALAGTAFLIYLGIGCLRAARAALKQGWKTDEQVSEHPAPLLTVYLTGLAMTAINPMTLAFWFGGLTSQALAQGIARPALPYLAAGVFLGTVTWVLTFSTLMTLLGRHRKPWWMAAADLIGGAVLLGFAGLSVVACGQRLLG